MKPTKYAWKQLLEKLEVGDEIALPLEHRNNAARAIQRFTEKRFTTQKVSDAVFKILRTR